MKTGERRYIRSQSSPGAAFALLVLILNFFLLTSFDAYAEQDVRGKAESLLKDATALFEEGSTDKAIGLAGEAVKADPGYSESYDRLGYMLLKAGKNDEAINAFEAALKINPQHRTSKTGKGLALLQKGDATGAEVVLKDALLLNPYPSMTHYALGLVYEKMNNYEQAVLLQFKEGIRTFKSGKR